LRPFRSRKMVEVGRDFVRKCDKVWFSKIF
jgi:hypothetical protein